MDPERERLEVPPELEGSTDDMAESRLYRRNRRIRVVAWVVVISLIIAGGGSTILLTLFG
ncbi:hypothetical protein [Microbacterium excoecariae]|uniref:hypothetical protein n=1 Tax=Microbacterium excoecariae TaxID=2715210 RepID=UPI00140869E3|nr:hypothetical protein [Microbacterium excoecariae]NHI15956.1 hypothetical protein [Microbacterium excoecariae]